MVVTSFITKKKCYFFINLVWDTNRTIIKARGALFGIGYFSLVWDTDQTIFFFFLVRNNHTFKQWRRNEVLVQKYTTNFTKKSSLLLKDDKVNYITHNAFSDATWTIKRTISFFEKCNFTL